jgi:hypothetical protein
MHAVSSIPYTLTGKKMEVAVRRTSPAPSPNASQAATP